MYRRLVWVLFVLVFSLSNAFSQLPENFIIESDDTTWTIHVAAGIRLTMIQPMS
jgi:hypothetical protein